MTSSRGRRIWLTGLLAVFVALVLLSTALFVSGWYTGEMSALGAALSCVLGVALLWLAGGRLRAEIRRSRGERSGQPV